MASETPTSNAEVLAAIAALGARVEALDGKMASVINQTGAIQGATGDMQAAVADLRAQGNQGATQVAVNEVLALGEKMDALAGDLRTLMEAVRAIQTTAPAKQGLA